MRTDIQKGDLVEYVDAKAIFDFKLRKRIVAKISIFGIWDGEKVVCDDDERTTVRKKEWLELIFPSL